MAKRKSNDGKELEKLVNLLHQALKDENTKIYRNVQVPYKLGGDSGEIDILIVSKGNGFEYRTAIECKDYSTPVKGAIVDTFSSKCNRMVNIDKKVIVSSRGFQKGARDAANANGVALCTLLNVSGELTSEWVNVENMRQLLVDRIEIIEYQAITSDNSILFQEYLDPATQVFLSNGEIIPLFLLIKQTAMQFHNHNVRELVNILTDKELLNHIEKTIPVKLFMYFGPTNELTITIKTNSGRDFDIQKIEFGINFYCKLFQPYKINGARRYIDFINDDIKADTVSFEINNSNFSMVKVPGSSDPKLYIINKNGDVEELIETPN